MNLTYVLAAILEDDTIPLPRAALTDVTVRSILQLVFAIAGAIALLVITIAGLRFVVANGDPQSVAKAKNTIIYATLGLIICISGFSIVTYLLRQV